MGETESDNSVEGEDLESDYDPDKPDIITNNIDDESIGEEEWGGGEVKKKNKNAPSFSCAKCNFTTISAYKLKLHIKAYHSQNKHICDLCDYRATSSKCLRIHKESVHYGMRYSCDLCNFSVSDKKHLNRHIQSE